MLLKVCSSGGSIGASRTRGASPSVAEPATDGDGEPPSSYAVHEEHEEVRPFLDVSNVKLDFFSQFQPRQFDF